MTWSRLVGALNAFIVLVFLAVAEEPTGTEPDGLRREPFPIPKMTALPKGLEPFRYVPAKIAFYPPGGSGRGDGQWNRMQLPLPAAESVRHMVTPVGFQVRLFASEPDIGKPICLAWDERGRLWIAETVDYPNDKRPEGQGRDRIRICEDTDGDGRADRFTVFADHLSIPTSLAFAYGGVIVHQPPHTLFLKDTDGDDRADIRRILITGWSTADTHAGPSNLRYGFDNWYWGVVGYAGFDGTVAGRRHRFRQGFYRFRLSLAEDGLPEVTALEFIRSTNNNTWGLGFSEEGIVFASTANRNPSVYMPIANRYYERVRGWSASQLGTIAESHLFRPITDKIRQVDHHGGYTAAAGHALYTARHYPRPYWNRAAFVCGPTGHLVGTFVVERRGADFRSRYLFNLLASDDEWTAPIAAEVGPDGNVWFIDWYNYIVQHNPTPVGFKTGKGNAYITPLRDKRHGRIYRIIYQEGTKASQVRLDHTSAQRLVSMLGHSNLLWRQHAQRLLVERRRLDVVPDLLQLVRRRRVDSIGLDVAAIHALWTLHGLGALNESASGSNRVVEEALQHPSPAVRRSAVLVLPHTLGSVRAILKADLLHDADPQVRLAALLALASMPVDGEAAQAIAAVVQEKAIADDRWLRDAATSAAAAHAGPFLIRLARTANRVRPQLRSLVRIVAEHYARSAAADEASAPDAWSTELLPALRQSDPVVAEAVLAGLARGWPGDRRLTLSRAEERAIAEMLTSLSLAGRSNLLRLATAWGSKEAGRYADKIVGSLRRVLVDTERPVGDRVNAASQLISFRPGSDDVIDLLLAQVTPQSPPELVSGVFRALGLSRVADLGDRIVPLLARWTPTARSAAIRMLLTRSQTTRSLLAAAEQGRFSLDDLTLEQRQMLLSHPDAGIARRARALLARGGSLPSPDREKILQQLLPLAQKRGDADLGKQVFKKHCSQCHRHGTEGNAIGPDLTGMAVHPKAELLTHIIDPSRSVEGNYRLYTVALADGRLVSGMLAAESRTTVELIDTEGKKHVIQRNDIDELLASKKSLMPEGFEKQLSPSDLCNLLEFLTARRRFIPLDLRKVATIVSTRGMFYRKDSVVERLVFPDWSPKVVEGVPFHLIDPQGDRVANVVMLYSPHGRFPPRMPRSVSLPCRQSVKAIHFLSGVSGWGAKQPKAKGTVCLIVRLHYDDGQVEDHPLRDGRHFADYIGLFDVPESKRAFNLGGRQVRYFAIQPRRQQAIDRIELIKGPDHTAPVIVAITVETAG